jgi:hypothetical protein
VHAGADLFAVLGYSLDPATDPPHAAAVWYGLGGDPAAGPAFLHLDPVHLRVTLEGSHLADPRELALQPEEVASLTAALNQELFTPEGATLHAVTPEHWLLPLPEAPAMTTQPLEAWLGGDARAGLPQGPEAAAWHRRLNEAQMVLANAAANREREQLGRPAVNSLWPWGAGKLPEAPAQRRYARVYGGGAAAAGLARLTGSAAGEQPADYRQWRAEAGPEAELVICDGARQAAARGDPEGKTAVLEQLDMAWLQPALADLKRGALGSLQLVLGPPAGSGPGPAGADAVGVVLRAPAGRRWPRPGRCPVSERSPRGRAVGWTEWAT